MVCLTITAFAQTHKTSPAGTQTFTPVEPDAPAVIDQEITSTMQVSHPDASWLHLSLRPTAMGPVRGSERN